jgi:hypothetical protein
MVIARTDLDVPTFLLVPRTSPALGDVGGRIRHRIGMLSRRAAAAVTGVFSRPDSVGSAAVPARRPAFLADAAMGREMFRL